MTFHTTWVENDPDLVESILRPEGLEPIDDERDNENYGFEVVEDLEGNIGYLRLSEFSDTKYAGDTAVP